MAIGSFGRNISEDQILADISAAVSAGDLNRAGRLANMAVVQGIRQPLVFNARGLALQASGHHQEALKDFNVSLSLAPHNPLILNAIGASLLALERLPEAVKQFDAALVENPNHAPTFYRRGLAQAMQGHHDFAEADFERAIAIDPNYAEALASLASVMARKRKTKRARALAERAIALRPAEPTALYALAMVEMVDGDFAGAERRLRPLLSEKKLPPAARAGAYGLLGDALDGQGRYSEAFATYLVENEDLRRSNLHRFEQDRGADAVQHLIAYFEGTPAAQWAAHDDYAPDDGPDTHVFLLGFMRSGTTLLEQVLASNPKIVAAEEKGTLNGLGAVFMTSNEGLDALANLDEAGLRYNRNLYWERVRALNLGVRGKVFVDKQPLNTMKMPLIAKLFPKAKIIFALRDPRDVVFSCFRRHFQVNVTMFEFLALDDAARFYASVMRLAELYREKLPLNVFEHRYEDMVQNFEARVRAVCEYMDVEWSDSMREFDKIAPIVDLRSPSAAQVRRPLYGDAIEQWRRYREQLEPIFPILQPWIEKFGYASD